MDTSVLDLLDKEAAKLPTVSKKSHDAQFEELKRVAQGKSGKILKRGMGKMTTQKEHQKRLKAVEKAGGDLQKAAFALDIPLGTLKCWYQRYDAKLNRTI